MQMGRALAVSIAIALSSCSIAPTQPDGPLRAAWIELGPDGATLARAITTEDRCPSIAIDDAPRPMNVRVAPGTAPLRPTANAPADSKPSSFPVTVCELTLPPGARRASIGSRALPLPKPTVRRIVVLGDTGCRMKKSDNVWQRCDDTSAWPFAVVAASAARFAPDLVLHVGDYHYRETACPSGNAGCVDSPWGYGWDAWNADFFVPAAPLLAAAPWIVVRGNHEECLRAGQGWFRFLDPHPFEPKRSCDDPANDGIANYTPTYAVALGDRTQMIVFDSAKAGYTALPPTDPQFIAYRAQFEQARSLAATPDMTSIMTVHHPMLAYAANPSGQPFLGTASLQSVARTLFGSNYFPAGVSFTLQGHMHDFQAIDFSTGQPPTIVTGMGGDLLDPELPNPFPRNLAPAPGATLSDITHTARFGFVVLDRLGASWSVTLYTRDSHPLARCALSGPRVVCDPSGLIPQ